MSLGLQSAAAAERGAVDVTLADTGKHVTLYKKSYALVIGIDAYTNGWPVLRNAINDAKAVKNALETQGFEVTLKKNLKYSELIGTLQEFFILKGADPETRLLIWFAGHGHTVKLFPNLPATGFLVAADTPIATQENIASFQLKALPLSTFGYLMRQARAKHVLAVFDSCFSGSVFTDQRALPPTAAISLATTRRVRQMISSGEAKQKVSDDGTFRRLFIGALTGEEQIADGNRDGFLTGSELGSFLHHKMTNLTNKRRVPRSGKLNFLGFDRGDFVFPIGKTISPQAPKPLTPTPTAELCTDRQHQRARDLYEKLRGTEDKDGFEFLIKKYPHCDHAGLAKFALKRLVEKERQVSAAQERLESLASNEPAGPVTDKSRIKYAQERLAALGFKPGKADGVAGSNTKRAIEEFQQKNDLEVDGELTAKLLQLLKDPTQGIGNRTKGTPMPTEGSPGKTPRVEPEREERARRIFVSIRDSNDIKKISRLIREYPNTLVAQEAKLLVEELQLQRRTELIQAGRPIRKFYGDRKDSHIFAFALSPKSEKAVTLGGKKIRYLDLVDGRTLWNVTTPELPKPEQYLKLRDAIIFGPDGKTFFVILGGNSIWEFSAFKGGKVAEFRADSTVTSIAVAPKGKELVAGYSDGSIRIWQINTGTQIKSWTGHQGFVSSVAYSPNGFEIASTGSNDSVKFWDSKTGFPLGESKTRGTVRSISYSPNGELIAYGSEYRNHSGYESLGPQGGYLEVMIVKSGKHRDLNIGNGPAIYSVTWSSDGSKIVAGDSVGRISIWDASTGVQSTMLEGHERSIRGLALLEHENSLISAGGNKVLVWGLK